MKINDSLPAPQNLQLSEVRCFPTNEEKFSSQLHFYTAKRADDCLKIQKNFSFIY